MKNYGNLKYPCLQEMLFSDESKAKKTKILKNAMNIRVELK